MELSDINLLDPDVFTKGVPHEWFTYLRKNAPVYHHPEPNGPGFYVISKHEDVGIVELDAKTYSSAAKYGGVVGLEEPTPAEREDLERQAAFTGNMMLYMDPPDHTLYRKIVHDGFRPRMIWALEQRVRERAIHILDDAIAQGECDFVVDVAAELPLQAIAELLGVPMEDRHKLFDWSNRMIGSVDPEYAVSEENVRNAQVEMFMYAQELAADRRANPRDDIVTKLLEAEVDGHSLSELDFNLFFLLLAVAGNETTRNAISHGMAALLDNPEQYDILVEDPSAIDTAVEEIIRWASPVMYFRRNVTQDAELRGQKFKAGDKLSLWYISANRDEDVFEEPFKFDIRRDPNPHIAFGHGHHFCLGFNLARLEVKVLFEELAKRVTKIESVGDLSRLRSNFIAGIKHLPVRFTKTRQPAGV
ncbi:MAG TPA: cytochrome P450 [Actinomycetota bacterium]|nr:cytochrome P450 [Actinomycetota bacterium]